MDDGIEANASTFALEMRETAFILHNVGPGSMIIMDELGRGTSTRDGLAIALSVCEAMVKSKVLLVLCAVFRGTNIQTLTTVTGICVVCHSLPRSSINPWRTSWRG